MTVWHESARRAAELLGILRRKTQGWVLRECPACSAKGGVAFINNAGYLSCKRASCTYHDSAKLRDWTAELLGWGEEQLRGDDTSWRRTPRLPEPKIQPPARGKLWTPLTAQSNASCPGAQDSIKRWATQHRGWEDVIGDGLVGVMDESKVGLWIEEETARKSGAGSLWSSAHQLWVWAHDRTGKIISAVRRATRTGVGTKELSLSNEASRARDVRLIGTTLPEAIEVAKRGGPVWVCEGTPDTLAALALLKAANIDGAVIGFPGTSEARKGANAIRQALTSQKIQARFLIWPHNDASGAGQRSAEAVAKLLRLAGEVKIVRCDDADLSDALRDRGWVSVLKTSEEALPSWCDEPDRAKRREHTKKAVLDALQTPGVCTLKVPTGDGKSTATLQGIAAQVAAYKRGTKFRGCLASPTHDLATEVFTRLNEELIDSGCTFQGTGTAGELVYKNKQGVTLRVVQLFALQREDADGPVCIHPAEATEAARTVEGGLSKTCRGCEQSHELPTKQGTRLQRRCRWGKIFSVADEKTGVTLVIGTHDALWPRDNTQDEAREWDLAVIDESPLKNRAEAVKFTAAQLLWARGSDLLKATSPNWTAFMDALIERRTGKPSGASSRELACIMDRVTIAPLEQWRDAADAPARQGKNTHHLPDWRAVEALADAQNNSWKGCFTFDGELHLWRPKPEVRAKTVLYLDATTTPYIAQAIAPGSRWVEIEALLPDRWTVLRASEAFTKRDLDPKRGSKRKRELWNALLYHACQLDRELGGTGPLIVAPGCIKPGKPVGELDAPGLEAIHWTYYGAADAVGSNLHKDRRVVLLTDFHLPRRVILATAERLAILRNEPVDEQTLIEAERQLRERAILQAMGRLRGEDVTVILCTQLLEGTDTDSVDLPALALGAGQKTWGREASISILRTWVERAGIAIPEATPPPELVRLRHEAFERIASTWSGNWSAAAEDAGLVIQNLKVLGLNGGKPRVALATSASAFLDENAIARAAQSIEGSSGVELRGRAILWAPIFQEAARQAPRLARSIWQRRQDGLDGYAALAVELQELFNLTPRTAGRIRDRLLEANAQIWLESERSADITWLQRAASHEELTEDLLLELDALIERTPAPAPILKNEAPPPQAAAPPPPAPRAEGLEESGDYNAARQAALAPNSWPEPGWSGGTTDLFFLLTDLIQEGHAPPASLQEARAWSPLLLKLKRRPPS